MALDSENEEERAATWNSFPKVNLREGRKQRLTRVNYRARGMRGRKADSDKITNHFAKKDLRPEISERKSFVPNHILLREGENRDTTDECYGHESRLFLEASHCHLAGV